MEILKSEPKMILYSAVDYYEWSVLKEAELKTSGHWWAILNDDVVQEQKQVVAEIQRLSIDSSSNSDGSSGSKKNIPRPSSEWRNANMKAIMSITSCLGPTILSNLGALTTAKQYWARLREMYEETWSVRRWTLLDHLFSVPMRLWRSIDAKGSTLRLYNRELRLVSPEDALSERALALLLLQGLSRDFDLIKEKCLKRDQDKNKALMAAGREVRKERFDWNGLVAALKIKEEQLRKQKSADYEAKMAKEIGNKAKVFSSRKM